MAITQTLQNYFNSLFSQHNLMQLYSTVNGDDFGGWEPFKFEWLNKQTSQIECILYSIHSVYYTPSILLSLINITLSVCVLKLAFVEVILKENGGQ